VFGTYDSLPGGGSPDELGGIPELPVYEGECDGYQYHLCYDLRPFEAIIVAFPGPDVPDQNTNKTEQ
jgi:hypothetical protein